MKYWVISVLGLVAFYGTVQADIVCPDRIQFTNGSYLKNGDRFYYNNGSYLINSGKVYYSNGSYLKNGDNVYFTNGSYLAKGEAVYYPNGSYLKNGDRYYYSNGSYFKNGEKFYHPNGSYARSNGRLYRADGTETAFPVLLSQTIPELGELRAEVAKDSEWIDLNFKDLVTEANGARVSALWNGKAFSEIEAVIKTGAINENVLVRVTSTGVFCTLDTGAVNPGSSFTLDARAARVQVQVKPGYDPADIKYKLEALLNSLQP